MPRIDLQVPFPQKDEAKNLGARWDVKLKRWYVPDGVDPTAFAQWISKPRSPHIRAPSWCLVASTRECWRCGATSSVFEIRLPPGYEALYVADDPADDCWVVGENWTRLSYVVDLPENVAAQLYQRAPRYRVDFSQFTQSFYRMNHCEHCDAKLGDFETLQEFGAFESCVELARIYEPFTASCGGYTL